MIDTAGAAERRDPHRTRLEWGVPVLLGASLVAVGVLAMIMSFAAGVAAIILLGALFVGAGIVEIVAGSRGLPRRRFWLTFLAGLLSVLAGVLLLARPFAGLAATTALIGAYFVAIGLFRIATSVVHRYEHWGWDLAYGLLVIALGAIVLGSWPVSSVWFVGLLLGIELVVRGGAWIGVGVAMRRTLRTSAPIGAPARSDRVDHGPSGIPHPT